MLETNVRLRCAPLAFMRGRTLNEAFIIMDEAQNTTNEQMKMFLTRMGSGSKAVITGDLTQIDLPGPKRSGLFEALSVLDGVEASASATSRTSMWCAAPSGAAHRASVRQLRPQRSSSFSRWSWARASQLDWRRRQMRESSWCRSRSKRGRIRLGYD